MAIISACALGELLYVLGGLVALWFTWRVLVWGCLRPRRLGRVLHAQGLRGTAYRFPSGDLKEEARLLAELRTKPLPLSTHDIVARVEPLVHSNIHAHGKVSMIWFGPTPRVILNDPSLVREVLSSSKFREYRITELPSNVINLIGKGLVFHEGEKWSVHRTIIRPAFHIEKLKKMLPALISCTSELMGRWEDSMGSDSTLEIDVWPELQDLTGDAISRAAFGSSLSEGRRIFQIQSEQFKLLNNMPNLYIPGYTYLPTKLNRRIKANAREVEALLKGIITKREVAIKNGYSDDGDMLGLIMQTNIKESQEVGSSKPMMTMDDIIGELKLFYFVGMDTTAVLLTWTMIVLSMHPEWQDRARDEVLRVFENRQPDHDGANHLKVVTMVLNEVLRLYPPVTMVERETHKEMELGGIRYPAGVKLLLPILAIHHDPELWGEHVDEFRPERFEEGISKASKDAPAFFPFGWGPRICIGQNFALLEAKIALSMILQRFSFELSPSYTHAPFPVSTLQPEHGAQIKLKKI